MPCPTCGEPDGAEPKSGVGGRVGCDDEWPPGVHALPRPAQRRRTSHSGGAGWWPLVAEFVIEPVLEEGAAAGLVVGDRQPLARGTAHCLLGFGGFVALEPIREAAPEQLEGLAVLSVGAALAFDFAVWDRALIPGIGRYAGRRRDALREGGILRTPGVAA